MNYKGQRYNPKPFTCELCGKEVSRGVEKHYDATGRKEKICEECYFKPKQYNPFSRENTCYVTPLGGFEFGDER